MSTLAENHTVKKPTDLSVSTKLMYNIYQRNLRLRTLSIKDTTQKASILRTRFLTPNYTFKPLKRGNLPIKDKMCLSTRCPVLRGFTSCINENVSSMGIKRLSIETHDLIPQLGQTPDRCCQRHFPPRLSQTGPPAGRGLHPLSA